MICCSCVLFNKTIFFSTDTTFNKCVLSAFLSTQPIIELVMSSTCYMFIKNV